MWPEALLLVLTALLASLASLPAVAAPGDEHWDRQFAMAGTSTRNFALRFHDNRLYTAGYSAFNGQVDTNTVVNIFDGERWTTLGGITGGTTVIYDFAFLGSDLYVGGVFSQAGGVPAVGLAKWDGAGWSDVGGFSGLVFAMTTEGSNLYVGGAFTNAGGILATNIARWDGTNWSALGDGIGYYDNFIYPSVNAMAWNNGQLYVGGAFTNSGTTAVMNLASWDGGTWSPVGGGVAGMPTFTSGPPVSTLQFQGDDLYVGGTFTTVGNNVAALNVAKWGGNDWSALGSGLKGSASSSSMSALAFLGTDLYASGNFTNAGGVAAFRVAKWDGFSWSSIGNINSTPSRAVSNSGSLYLCGDFSLAGNVIGNHIIRWDGDLWHAVTGKPAQGTHFFVQALGLAEDGLYMGGFFSAVGAISASRVARWDGTNWYALGEGLTRSFSGSLDVRAIKARNNQVYIGGNFSSAGGIDCTNIALWDGSNWSPLASGFDAVVGAIEVTPTDVYVGGAFTNAYNFPGLPTLVNRIARWDGDTWRGLGGGVNGGVNVISAANGLIYVGGSFTSAGGLPANRIATWDGADWSTLGAGAANGAVNAILVDGANLYVAGSFTTAGGVTTPGIARWDGNNWSSVGQGLLYSGTASVRGLAKIGSYLYVTGTFTNAGGATPARMIARWDGNRWEALGSGLGTMSNVVRGNTLAVWGNDLFAGGIFEDAGGVDSGYIARWNDQIDFAPPAILRLLDPQLLAGNRFKFRASATERAVYVVEHSANLVAWTPLLTNSLSFLEITNSTSDAEIRAYRMRQIP